MVLDSLSRLKKRYSQANTTLLNFISGDDHPKTYVLVVLLFILIFAMTLIKVTYTANATVFGDETYYNVFSKYLPNAQIVLDQGTSFAFVIAPLYYQIYSISHSFGAEFYEAAKILNSLFYSLSVFPIYALACIFVRPRVALLICIAACTAPYATYASYFMPESLYYFLFWVFAYVFIKSMGRNLLLAGLVSGFILGALYSTKVHALIIVAATNVTLLAFIFFRRRLKLTTLHIIASIIVLNASFLLTAAAIRYAVYGTLTPIGIDPKGGFIAILMGGYLTGNSLSALLSANTLREVFNVVLGQILFLSLLFMLPIVVTLNQLWRFIRARSTDSLRIEYITLCLFSTSALLGLLALSIKFTVVDFQLFNFIHSRYFNFIFPIFIINYYAIAKNYSVFSWFKSRWFLAFSVVGSLVLVFAMFLIPNYQSNWIDQPELDGLARMPSTINGNNNLLYLVAIIGIVVLLLHNKMRRNQRWIVGAALAGTLLVSHYYIFIEQTNYSKNMTRYQEVSGVFNAIIPPAVHNAGLIVSITEGYWDAFVFRFDGVPFHKVAPAGSMLDAWSIGRANIPWIVLTAPYCLNIPLKNSIALYDGFTLGFIDTPALQKAVILPAPLFDYKFTSDCSNPGVLQGFYDPQIDGTWSRSDTPEVVLPDPVKGTIQLELSALAFGPNAGRAIEVVMGDQKQTVTFSKEITTLTLTFTLAAPTNSIKFNGIQPTSEAALGIGTDSRLLGIKIERLSIRALPLTI